MTLELLSEIIDDFKNSSYWNDIKDVPITMDIEGFQKMSFTLHTTEYLGEARIVFVQNKAR